jgi:hypothetical protein
MARTVPSSHDIVIDVVEGRARLIGPAAIAATHEPGLSLGPRERHVVRIHEPQR